jgi:hypothetical protein
MPQMEGVITIAQESRFQMMDRQGASHLFTLDSNASAEPAQLAPLAARQAFVRVKYRQGKNVLGAVAEAIYVDPASEQGR